MHEYASEIHKLLKLTDPAHEDPSELDLHVDDAHEPVGLPVEEMQIEHDSHGTAVAVMPGIESLEPNQFNWKSLLVYPAIFFAAFAFFYIILNFSSVWSQVEGVFTKPQSQEILGVETAEYYKWISNYFYAVGDPKLLEPTNDIDKDGLTNHDEFTMRTNPLLADSDNDGFSDGIEVINTQNPWGSGSFTAAQLKLAENLDVIMVNNRLSYNVSQNPTGTVAGTSLSTNYDLEKPGRLSIPKLKLQVPLIWSKDPSDFEADLTRGVIHYPGTALPGENGIIYVSGHSSDYIWKRDPMHDVFAKLNYLAPGDDIFIDVYGKDGKVYNYRYQVSDTHTYKPDDQAQFIDNSGSKLNLSTCWPIGTLRDRLVVSAVPVGL
jgi:LPXTG-site transpeptidase (sortase) family protein